MKENNLPLNQLEEEIYTQNKSYTVKVVAISALCLVVGVVSNISFEDKLNNFLKTALASNPNCSINFEKVSTGYFPPKINFLSPIINGNCFGQPGRALPLESLTASLNSPSFYPVGIRFHINAKTDGSYINAYPVISLLSQNVKIEKTLIDSKLFSYFTQSNSSPISGHISVEGFLEYKSKSLNDGEIDILSNNFAVPAQNLGGFELPNINLQKMQFSAHVTAPNQLEIEKIQLGDNATSVNMKLKGNVQLNMNNPNSSKLKLNGDFRLTEAFLANFAFLKVLLPANNTSGIYKMELNGTLGNPGIPKIQ